MFYKICIVVLGFALLSVSGCTNKPYRNNKPTQSFETDITSDGSKRFTLTITEPHRSSSKGERKSGKEQKRGQGGRGEGGQGGKRGQGRNGERSNNSEQGRNTQTQRTDEDNRSKILALLDEKLTATVYCRNGYIELDYNSVPGKTEIRGECQESASAEDKEKW